MCPIQTIVLVLDENLVLDLTGCFTNLHEHDEKSIVFLNENFLLYTVHHGTFFCQDDMTRQPC